MSDKERTVNCRMSKEAVEDIKRMAAKHDLTVTGFTKRALLLYSRLERYFEDGARLEIVEKDGTRKEVVLL